MSKEHRTLRGGTPSYMTSTVMELVYKPYTLYDLVTPPCKPTPSHENELAHFLESLRHVAQLLDEPQRVRVAIWYTLHVFVVVKLFLYQWTRLLLRSLSILVVICQAWKLIKNRMARSHAHSEEGKHLSNSYGV